MKRIIRINHSLPLDSFKTFAYPLEALEDNQITAIEGMAALHEGLYKGVCSRGCLGCSAEAISPAHTRESVQFLTPNLLKLILNLARNLAEEGVQIFSTTRLNLFSGSNESDNPHCILLRKIVSNFLHEMYGFPLGAISSDIVFHPSPSKVFRDNLLECLRDPSLFDNICVAIDEQLPIRDRKDYERLLTTYAWIWETLKPAIAADLYHPTACRLESPRVILNFLLPSPRNSYLNPFKKIYCDGPFRATTYEDLALRYVEPFLGRLVKTTDTIPAHHMFTTAIGTFSNFPRAKVYIAEAVFEGIGRANSFLSRPYDFVESNYSPTIRTKLYPAGHAQCAIQACLAPNRYSEGELPWSLRDKPSWVDTLNETMIDLSNPIVTRASQTLEQWF